MGNVGGVVQWLSTSAMSKDGLTRWEENALSALSPDNKIIDAARLVAAWPHLRGSFLSYVQSGRWVQSYYAMNNDQLLPFPVQLQHVTTPILQPSDSASTLNIDDGCTVLTEKSACQTVQSLQETVRQCPPSSKLSPSDPPAVLTALPPFDSALRKGPQSYALLLAAVFPLYLQYLQGEQERLASLSTSAPVSPATVAASAAPPLTAQASISQLLDSFGGNNPQENALRQYLIERFFVSSTTAAAEVATDAATAVVAAESPSKRSSIYQPDGPETPCTPVIDSEGREEQKKKEEEMEDTQKQLWHLQETLVSAMAQLDFMQLHEQLAQTPQLQWARDLVGQLEALSIGVAVVSADDNHSFNYSNNDRDNDAAVSLDGLRLRYCNSRFAHCASSFSSSLSSSSASPFGSFAFSSSSSSSSAKASSRHGSVSFPASVSVSAKGSAKASASPFGSFALPSPAAAFASVSNKDSSKVSVSASVSESAKASASPFGSFALSSAAAFASVSNKDSSKVSVSASVSESAKASASPFGSFALPSSASVSVSNKDSSKVSSKVSSESQRESASDRLRRSLREAVSLATASVSSSSKSNYNYNNNSSKSSSKSSRRYAPGPGLPRPSVRLSLSLVMPKSMSMSLSSLSLSRSHRSNGAIHPSCCDDDNDDMAVKAKAVEAEARHRATGRALHRLLGRLPATFPPSSSALIDAVDGDVIDVNADGGEAQVNTKANTSVRASSGVGVSALPEQCEWSSEEAAQWQRLHAALRLRLPTAVCLSAHHQQQSVGSVLWVVRPLHTSNNTTSTSNTTSSNTTSKNTASGAMMLVAQIPLAPELLLSARDVRVLLAASDPLLLLRAASISPSVSASASVGAQKTQKTQKTAALCAETETEDATAAEDDTAAAETEAEKEKAQQQQQQDALFVASSWLLDNDDEGHDENLPPRYSNINKARNDSSTSSSEAMLKTNKSKNSCKTTNQQQLQQASIETASASSGASSKMPTVSVSVCHNHHHNHSSNSNNDGSWRLLQELKVAEDVCNLLPPLLRL